MLQSWEECLGNMETEAVVVRVQGPGGNIIPIFVQCFHIDRIEDIKPHQLDFIHCPFLCPSLGTAFLNSTSGNPVTLNILAGPHVLEQITHG